MGGCLWVDTETRSKCDLKVHGVYNYAMDPTTEVLCMSYAFDDEEVRTWMPDDAVIPAKVVEHRGQIRAHNAAFERLIFKHVLKLNFEDEQFYCTATQARANCAPGALGDVARFAGTDMKKDYRGAQLIRWLSLPRPDGTFMQDDDLIKEMVAYCEQDVRAMREVSKSMRELSDEELYDYHVNERINDRGALVDAPLCGAAIKYAAQETQEIERLVEEITGGVLTSVRSPRMREWVYERVGPEAKKLMEAHKDGEKKISIDKSVRGNLLQLAEERPDDVPPGVADVIQCADDLWASSVAKFKRMADLADFDDDRVRGAFVFAGGSATGRAASYGLQVHNLARQCADDPEAVRAALVGGQPIIPNYGPAVTGVLKGMLRPAIKPAHGKVFVVADWAAIEARVNPWIADHASGTDVLDVFRTGADLYVKEAAKIFKCSEKEIGKDRRMIGKIAVLALGYQGSVGAFQSLARNYGVHMSELEVLGIVKAWRKANPWATDLWYGLEDAFKRAMRNPGSEARHARITYLFDGTHLWYSLPSGRILNYPFAKLDTDGVTYAKASLKPAADATEWPRASLYGGLACENVVQATANDILRHALRELDDLYYDIVLHVHDEIVIETDTPDQAIKDMTRIMTTAPSWAAGLPLAVDIKTMNRYGK